MLKRKNLFQKKKNETTNQKGGEGERVCIYRENIFVFL